ncbi:MAG: UvrD-helicase domain-containing protein [Clostridiales Family XIII bacterium]|jgi:DNA helicase-2/ATP-dependent DNA helicase PcrA|nr:UvrD-helicase domain-containing protein [Clostridiales Family XIII bacterium]
MINLNDKQKKAIETTEGPLLILAGAGSGKTATMVHRIFYLINEKNISPYNILGLTFTNKAAAEMRDRVEKLGGNTYGLTLATFHSFSARILRNYAEILGYTPSFAIYDVNDQKALLRIILKKQRINIKEYSVNSFISVISKAKENEIITDEDFSEYINSKGYMRERVDIYKTIFSEYNKELKNNNAFDFSDLISKLVFLLENNKDILEEMQERYKYIMVDEYQDTNELQYKLVYMLAKKNKNICVVGDDDQCIYEWRGANINNILNFEKDYLNTKIIRLEQNYRSTENILSGANSLIKNNKARKGKDLWTDKIGGAKIKLVCVNNQKGEANYVLDKIKHFSADYNYSDMAILYRTNMQSRSFEEAFIINGLSSFYNIFKGIRYYDRKEIRDIISYLRLIVNENDNLSFERSINVPARGIGEKALNRIAELAGNENESFFALLKKIYYNSDFISYGFSSNQGKNLSAFVKLILELKKKKDNLILLYEDLLEGSGYIRELEKKGDIESLGRIENLQEFKTALIERININKDFTLENFLEEISLIQDQDDYDSNKDRVSLMTVHSAKGLEFKIVFVVGMEEGLFPLIHNSTAAYEKIEEERRLFYVAMTRAMEKLYIIRASNRSLYGVGNFYEKEPSRFLDEIDENCIELEIKDSRKPKRFFFNSKEDFFDYDGIDNVDFGKSVIDFSEKKIKKPYKERDFMVGDIIFHKEFGRGMVLESDGENDIIIFDNHGRKILEKGFIKLTL